MVAPGQRPAELACARPETSQRAIDASRYLAAPRTRGWARRSGSLANLGTGRRRTMAWGRGLLASSDVRACRSDGLGLGSASPRSDARPTLRLAALWISARAAASRQCGTVLVRAPPPHLA
jgi:hypothetical protein